MGEHEITEAGPLLDAAGRLREPGWARRPLLDYERASIRAPAWRIKEWDYYCVLAGDYGLALTVADNGYMGFLAAAVLDLCRGGERSESLMTAFPLGRLGLPSSSLEGELRAETKRALFRFETRGLKRRLRLSWPDFGAAAIRDDAASRGDVASRGDAASRGAAEIGLEADIALAEAPGSDSLVIATPFAGSGRRFYYNRKVNCLSAEGFFRLGKREFAFERGKAFGVLDWGRGVWPWSNTWYWASASGLVGGRSFGLNLGYGFGDTRAASENALVLDGRLHKLGRTAFELDESRFTSPWRARSEDGRLDLRLEPRLDRASSQDFGLLASIQHQVFGHWSGKVILDGGEELRIEGLPGFAEKVVNRW